MQKACWEQVTPRHGSEQGTEGGLPTKEGRQEQEKLPRVLTHTALSPHTPGWAEHSSTSRHSAPAAANPGLGRNVMTTYFKTTVTIYFKLI